MRRLTAQRGEGGFTLVEMLVVIVILGIIGPVIAEAVILGLKTAQGTTDKVATTAAISALNGYFFADVQSADSVYFPGDADIDTASAGASADCAPSSSTADVILHLDWVNQGVSTDVYYAFEPPTPGTQTLYRRLCQTAGGTSSVTSTGLGVFVGVGATEPINPCTDSSLCPTTDTGFVTLIVQVDPSTAVPDPDVNCTAPSTSTTTTSTTTTTVASPTTTVAPPLAFCLTAFHRGTAPLTTETTVGS